MHNSIRHAPPLVSVVVPAYKAERWIAGTVASVQSQSYPNLEIIVVDDGSPDGTADIVADLAARDERLRLVRKENGGVGSARNAGFEAARGEFIALLDADDLWHPEKIARQVDCFERHSRAGRPVGMVYCWSQSIDAQSRVIRANVPRRPKEGRIFESLLIEDFLGNGSTALIACAAMREVGGFLESRDAGGCDEWELYLRIAHRFEVYAVDDYLVGYRRHGGGASANHGQMLRAHESLLDSVRSFAPETAPGLLRDSRSSLLVWLMVCSGPGSLDFRELFRMVFRHDRLFFARPFALRMYSHVVRASLLRWMGVVRGAPAGARFGA